MRRKRRGLRARGHRGSARGKSKGEFQKVAAFHDVSLFAYASDAKRVSSRKDERSLNWVFTIVVAAKAGTHHANVVPAKAGTHNHRL
jgi:hypothetical protein